MIEATDGNGNPISSYLQMIGGKGGRNGKGLAKTRSKAHYARLAKMRRKKKKQNNR